MILIGHGSRARGSDLAMKKVAAVLRNDKKFGSVACAYLEINSPSIPEAIQQAVASGANEVKLLPYFVHTGRHVLEDIPRIHRESVSRHGSKTKIKLCAYLGFHPSIVRVVKERLEK